MVDRMSSWFGADSHQPAVRQVQGRADRLSWPSWSVEPAYSRGPGMCNWDVQLGSVVLGNGAPLDGA